MIGKKERKIWKWSIMVFERVFSKIVWPVEVDAVELVLSCWMQILLIVLHIVLVNLLVWVGLVVLGKYPIFPRYWGFLPFLNDIFVLVMVFNAFLCFLWVSFLQFLLVSLARLLRLLLAGVSDGCVVFLGWFLSYDFAMVFNDFSRWGQQLGMCWVLDVVRFVDFFHAQIKYELQVSNI